MLLMMYIPSLSLLALSWQDPPSFLNTVPDRSILAGGIVQGGMSQNSLLSSFPLSRPFASLGCVDLSNLREQ